MPRVSIITPVYNQAQLLQEAVDSALKQTFQDFELIIIDDGSTDDTPSVVEKYQREHAAKIKYIYQKNSGPARARNRGLQEARGEYIAFLDSDDLWAPRRLEEGVKILDAQPKIALAHGEIVRITEEGQILEKLQRDPASLSGYIFESLLLRKAHIACLTVLVRRSCLQETGEFDETIGNVAEDRDLWLRITKKYPVAFIAQHLGYYRVRKESLSRNLNAMIEGNRKAIEKACAGQKCLHDKALAMTHKEIGDVFLLQKNFSRARREYWQAIRFSPCSLWPWVNWSKTFFNVS